MAERNRARTRTTVISSAVVLAVLIAAWMGYRAHAAESADDYVTATVSKGDVDQYLGLDGTVSEENQASVGFPASGTVTSLNVSLGDRVHAGQKLATMDDEDLKLAVTQAKADLASAKDELAKAQDDNSSSSSSSSSSSASPSTSSSSSSGASAGSTAGNSRSSTSTGSGSQGSGTTGNGAGGKGAGTGDGSGSAGNAAGNASGGTSGTSGMDGTGRNGGTGGTSGTGSNGNGNGQALSQIRQLEQRVNADTQQLASLSQKATDASNDQRQACAFLNATPPSSSPTDSGSPSPSTSESPTAPDSTTASPRQSTPSDSTSPSATETPSATEAPSAAPSSIDSVDPSASAEPSSTATPSPSSTAPASTTQDADFRVGSGDHIVTVDEPTSSSDQPSEQQLTTCVKAMQATTTAQGAVENQQRLAAQDSAALSTALQSLANQSSAGGGATNGSTRGSANGSAGGSTGGASGSSSSSSQASSQPSSSSSALATSGSTGSGSGGSGTQRASGGQQATGSSGDIAAAGSGGATSTKSGSDAAGGSIIGGQGSTMTVAEAKAAVTTAKINLNVARQKLAEATITSPIDGVVAGLDFAKGDSVSTSDKIVITGQGAMAVTVDVPGSKLDMIKKAQQATVGSGNSAGTITAIGLLPASDSSNSETSYPVTITVPEPKDDLADGASTTARIAISRATNVIRVPVSAVTQSGSNGVVTVMKDGAPQRTMVKIGAVGSTMVQITSGLAVGESVVIADRSQAIPSSDSSTTGGGYRRVVNGGGQVVVGVAPGGLGKR